MTSDLMKDVLERAGKDPNYLISLLAELKKSNGPSALKHRKGKDLKHFVGGRVLAPEQWRGIIIDVTDASVTVKTGRATRCASRSMPGLVLISA